MEEKQIGRFIRDRRLALGMTQQQLAERLGITDKAVSKWERCVSYPDITLLRALAEALEVSIAELLAGERDAQPGPAPSEAAAAAPHAAGPGETARQRRGWRSWRSWLFAAVSAGCLIAALVLLIVHFASGDGNCLLAVKCVAFGWALCYPLLRLQRPVWGFLVILSLAIVPFLSQFVSPRTHFWAHGIALLSVACLWAVYFLWRKILPRRPWLALAWSALLGVALALAINQILWGAAGVRTDAVSTWSNVLAGAVCFIVCALIDQFSCRRRAE